MAPRYHEFLPFGSGFIADKSGRVVTAKHVIEAIEALPRTVMSSPIGPNGPIDQQSIKVRAELGFPVEQLIDMEHRNYVSGNFSTLPFVVLKKSDAADVAILKPATNPLTMRWKPAISIDHARGLGPIPPRIPTFSKELPLEGEQVAASGFPLSIPSMGTNVC